MISLNWQGMEGEIGAIMARFDALPRHIAKKHLLAAIKRVGKDGVKILKQNTPKGRSRRIAGAEKMQRGGALRRAAMVRAKYYGRNADGSAVGVLGYKYGTESRKAIWLEFGTVRIAPVRMIERTMSQFRGQIGPRLENELVAALEKATAELASGMNPGMSRRGMAAGIAPRR